MSSPVTQEILDYVLARCLALSGLLPERVHAPSGFDTPVEQLPEIVVFGLDDRPAEEGDDDSAQGQVRNFTFGVTTTVLAEDEAATHQLAALIRQAVLEESFLGCHALSVSWDSQEWGSGAASAPTAMTKLTFTAHYNWRPEW